MRTAVIIQARYGSSRLPGKVLKDLRGRTVLSHVLERCNAITGVDDVVCAVSEDRESDAVAAEAARAGVHVFRGSESDVLQRYRDAALSVQAEAVLRVTSDCPLIDPQLCGRVLNLVTEQGYAAGCNNVEHSWPHGLDCESFQLSWLERAAAEAGRPSDREHVSPWIRRHPDVTLGYVSGPGGEAASWRWTLDTPADFRCLTAIFAELPEGPDGWSWQAVARVLAARPDLAGINAAEDPEDGWRRSMADDAKAGFPPLDFE